MSDKIRALNNQVTLTGKIAEITIRKDITREKVPYISIKGEIQFGDSKVYNRRFETFVQETKKDGSENKLYGSTMDFAKKVKSIATTSYDEATEVRVSGSVKSNDYVGSDDKLIESVQIDAKFFNDLENGETYKGTMDLEGYIQTIALETKGEDKEETGRLRVTLITADFFGNIIVVKNIIVPKDLKEDFESGYEVGQTANLYIDLIPNKAESKPKKTGGLGKQRETDGKSYIEMIVTGADPTIEEDDDNAVSKESIRIALSERKAMLAGLVEKGYQGGKSTSKNISNASKNSKPSVVNDEDIPF